MKKTISLILAPVILTSCCTETLIPVPVPDYEKDPKLQPPKKGSVLEPAEIVAYPVARYKDPKDPNVVHEQHVVYRVQAPKVRMASPNEKVVLGQVEGVKSGRVVKTSSESLVIDSKKIRQIEDLKSQVGQLAGNQKEMAELQVLTIHELQQMKNPAGQQNSTIGNSSSSQPQSYTPPSNE